MFKAIRIGKGVIVLALVAFIVMVVVGIYTALGAAPATTLRSTSKRSASTHTMSSEQALSAAFTPTDGATTKAATPSVSSDRVGSSGGVSTQSQPDIVSKPGGSSTGSKAGSATNKSTSSSSGSANSSKTYYPAWDEWVEEGHYETKTIPATYGERNVYGSICNECGANISGHAAQHLKDTQHSGYHEGVVGTETYIITPEKTEKVWVDTSHTVHHPACWK